MDEYRQFHARRMKLFPMIFGLIYMLIISFCIIYLQFTFLPYFIENLLVQFSVYFILGIIFIEIIRKYLGPAPYL